MPQEAIQPDDMGATYEQVDTFEQPRPISKGLGSTRRKVERKLRGITDTKEGTSPGLFSSIDLGAFGAAKPPPGLTKRQLAEWAKESEKIQEKRGTAERTKSLLEKMQQGKSGALGGANRWLQHIK